jgi:hypothetical protein
LLLASFLFAASFVPVSSFLADILSFTTVDLEFSEIEIRVDIVKKETGWQESVLLRVVVLD